MTPEQIDALERLLFLLFALIWIPIAWMYAEKRGRRPWLWALIAFFISWIALIILRLIPDKRKPSAPTNESTSPTVSGI